MDGQSTAPATALDAQTRGASATRRWTVLRRVRAHRHDETSESDPHLVGIRDQESGDVRIFRVYQPQAGAEQPPDPEPPPAVPAQAWPHVEMNDRDGESPGDGRCARAA